MGSNKSNFRRCCTKEYPCGTNYQSLDLSNRCSYVGSQNDNLQTRIYSSNNHLSKHDTCLKAIEQKLDSICSMEDDTVNGTEEKESLIQDYPHSDLAKAYMNLSMMYPKHKGDKKIYHPILFLMSK